MHDKHTIDRTCEKEGSFVENRTTKQLLLTIRKKLMEFQGQIMRKEGLENSTPTWYIKDKKSRSNLLQI